MTDREPVNIMGVIAFPNPDKDQRVIRFIDSEYHTLFTIKDGESIVITRFDGEKMVFPCKYIDDCHVCIGNSAYHICEFAEMQERNGNTYVPRTPKISDEICTYEIYQIPATADVDYYFRSYEAAKGKLQSADYQRSYAGMYAKENSLEDLWAKHNRDSPSLCPSDAFHVCKRHRGTDAGWKENRLLRRHHRFQGSAGVFSTTESAKETQRTR